MRYHRSIPLTIAMLILAHPASATITRHTDPIDADSPGRDIVSTARVRWTEDGQEMIRFAMHFAAEAASATFDGRIRLDTKGGGAVDAAITYFHWDNGPNPTNCRVRAGGTSHRGKAGFSPSGDRFKCTFPLSWLDPDGPVRWAIVHGDAMGSIMDLAPDTGWYR